MKLIKLLVPALASAVLIPYTARADCGHRGVVVLEATSIWTSLNLHLGARGDSSSRSGIDLGANLKYFVADHVWLGVGIDVVRQSDDDDDTTTALAARFSAGYQLRTSARVHL